MILAIAKLLFLMTCLILGWPWLYERMLQWQEPMKEATSSE